MVFVFVETVRITVRIFDGCLGSWMKARSSFDNHSQRLM